MVEVNGVCKHGRYERIWLKSLRVILVFATQDDRPAGRTRFITYIHMSPIWIKKCSLEVSQTSRGVYLETFHVQFSRSCVLLESPNLFCHSFVMPPPPPPPPSTSPQKTFISHESCACLFDPQGRICFDNLTRRHTEI